MRVDGVVHSLTQPPTLKKQEKHTIDVVVDRLTVQPSSKRRLTDLVETALGLGGGLVTLDFVDLPEDDPHRSGLSEHLARLYDDLSFEELEPRSFSFNLPFGACPECTGLAPVEVDPELVIPDPTRSPADGAVAPWSAGQTSEYFTRLVVALSEAVGFRMDTPWERLPARACGGPARVRRPGARALRQPVRARALVLHPVRGRQPVRRATPRGGGERH